MRFSSIVGAVIVCMAVCSFGQNCDSIRKVDNKYFCGEMRLKTNADFKNALASNPIALSTYNSAVGLSAAANIFASLGGGLLGYGLGSMLFNDSPVYPIMMGVGGGIALIGIGMGAGAGSKVKKAIHIYNGGQNPAPTSDLYMNLYPNGAMVTYSFGR
jgi:hypothetical protein